MPLYDYRCLGKCHRTFEAFADPEQKRVECPLCKEGYAERVYLRMAPLPGRNKGRYPVFDQQLGCVVESSQHRDRIAKERGLVTMGPEEFQRSINNHHDNDPLDNPKVDPDLIDAAERAYASVQKGEIPPDDSPSIENIEADFLDVSSNTGAH